MVDSRISFFPVRRALQVVILGLQFGNFNLGALPRLVSLVAALCHLCDLRIDLTGEQVSFTRLGKLLGVQFYKRNVSCQSSVKKGRKINKANRIQNLPAADVAAAISSLLVLRADATAFSNSSILFCEEARSF